MPLWPKPWPNSRVRHSRNHSRRTAEIHNSRGRKGRRGHKCHTRHRYRRLRQAGYIRMSHRIRTRPDRNSRRCRIARQPVAPRQTQPWTTRLRSQQHRFGREFAAGHRSLLWGLARSLNLFQSGDGSAGPPARKRHPVIGRTPEYNVLVECFSVHARNLLDFFWEPKPKKSDHAIARHFVDDVDDRPYKPFDDVDPKTRCTESCALRFSDCAPHIQ